MYNLALKPLLGSQDLVYLQTDVSHKLRNKVVIYGARVIYSE